MIRTHSLLISHFQSHYIYPCYHLSCRSPRVRMFTIFSIFPNEKSGGICHYPFLKWGNLYITRLVYPSEIGNEYAIYKLYEDLYEGKAIEFDLCIGNRPCFDMKKNFSILTKTKFVRKLQF